MNKTNLLLAAIGIFAFSSAAADLPTGALPQPEFEKKNFLLTLDIEEMNVDFAIAWTDSVASFFVYPFDAVVLHVDVGGAPRDVFVVSDMSSDRLMAWMCTRPNAAGNRELLVITEFDGEEGDEFKAPSGLATNAINREFIPNQDVIYVADRGNNRIVELRYFPDESGGTFAYNRILGAGFLEWPVDVAISAYGDGGLNNADLYVVDWGHQPDDGELVRINVLSGQIEGSWHDVLYPQSEIVITELKKPISVACFPYESDSLGLELKTAIYVTEAVINTVFLFKSKPNSDPVWLNLNMLRNGDFIRLPGGIALDDFGRVYIANNAAGMIEMYGPNMNYVYDPYGTMGTLEGQLNYPSNLILDTYNNECEALVMEMYGRESGLQTYKIPEGWSSDKPPLGFDGSALPKVVGDYSGPLPTRYVLGDAYPNPFNAQCIISFSLPRETRVRIDIFNILGQRVATALNETKDAGEHSITFYAREFSSGVYFYRLSTDKFSQTKSMVLLK